MWNLVPCSLAFGCLAADPGSRGKQDARAGVVEKTGGQKKSAPLAIDPAVLAGRAFGEAPMLAEKVLRGELPPVSERLPENPLVVVPMDEIGRYGGRYAQHDMYPTLKDAERNGRIKVRLGLPAPESTFRLNWDVVPGMGVDVCQLAADYWRAVGIGVHLNVALRDILFPKWSSGTFEVFWWGGWSDDPVVNRNDWAITGPNQPVWHRNAISSPRACRRDAAWNDPGATLWTREAGTGRRRRKKDLALDVEEEYGAM